MQNVVSYSFLFKIKVYGFMTVSVVLYTCETWSLVLREERRLRMFENSELNIIPVLALGKQGSLLQGI